jgi:hypothetical protein
MSFEPMRAPVAAERAGPRIALLTLQLAPAAHARRAHTEPLAGLAVRQTPCDRSQHPNPKIDRQSFRHPRRPPTRQAV